MSPKFILDYFRKCHHNLKSLGEQENVSVFLLWCDSIWSYLRYGCTIRQYVDGEFFRYSLFERSKILTCRKYYKLVRRTNNVSYTKFLEDKALFNNHFSDFVHRRWVTSRDMTKEKFLLVCQRQKGIIIKPLGGMEGQGIYKIAAQKLLSENEIEQAYRELQKTDSIIEELVEQHPLMRFNSESVNTIRAITLMDKNTHEIKMLKTVLRAGVGNAVVDNYHQGGCCYEVDVESGRICSFGISAKEGKTLFHPGTDICMMGYEIPNWKHVIDGCIKAHSLLPECRYISWDVAITEDGIELIEGNHNGDYDMFEFVGRGKHWPTLKKYL